MDVLRQELAKRLELGHFRRLSLACGPRVLGPGSAWNADALVAVVRPFVADEAGELFEVAQGGNLEALSAAGQPF